MIVTDTHPQASSVTGRFALTWRRTSISTWSASHRPRQQQGPSSMAADSGSLHSSCAVCCASHSYRGCGRCSWPCRAGECCISAAGSHGILVSSQSSGLEAALQDAGCISHHAVVRCTCQGAWHHHGEPSPIYSGNDMCLRPFCCNPRCCYSTAGVLLLLSEAIRHEAEGNDAHSQGCLIAIKLMSWCAVSACHRKVFVARTRPPGNKACDVRSDAMGRVVCTAQSHACCRTQAKAKATIVDHRSWSTSD